jgi:hypothetical protein
MAQQNQPNQQQQGRPGQLNQMPNKPGQNSQQRLIYGLFLICGLIGLAAAADIFNSTFSPTGLLHVSDATQPPTPHIKV